MNLIKLLHTLILCAGLLACANEYAYDSNNPDAYKKHWENNVESKNNEVLYLFSEECKENKEKTCF
ncbi:MAG TPA: hypothetical protein VIQ03_00555 [Gammaproteobacteria bacterium]